MNQALLEKIQNLIEEEVRVQINRYAQIISKRHDISLRLLLHDMENLNTSSEVSTRCLGITGKLEGPKVPQVEYFVCFSITSGFANPLASLIRHLVSFTGKKTQCLAAGKSLGAPPLVRIFCFNSLVSQVAHSRFARSPLGLLAGKYDGYCSRHVIQRKVPIIVPQTPTGIAHVGHTLRESLFLPGCPACEKTREKPKMMIDF